MKNTLSIIIILLIIFTIPFVSFAQIDVFESKISDSTKYTNSINQDTVFIVYKGENNKSTITIFAGLNNIDSLNYVWYKYNNSINDFVFLEKTDTVKTDTIFYGIKPGEDMNTYEGGYKVRIHNLDKGIDTTFVMWLWYQDFFINSVTVYASSCTKIELVADTTFQDLFSYYDLSIPENSVINIKNHVDIKWVYNPPIDDDSTGFQARTTLSPPVEPTTYLAYGIDQYNFNRVRSLHIDETDFDNKGYPILRAVNPEFSGIHGVPNVDNKPSKDTAINLQAPYGVMFYNKSKNADIFEWIFYNHQDWRLSEDDTTLHISTAFEPFDSIYYNRPVKHTDFQTSPIGYDVKLSVWGPEYNINSDRCLDSIRKINFVIVDTTQFPSNYMELPNVFTPNATNNNYFHFMESGDEKPVKSIKYFSIKIYNRWGNKIYEYEDNDGSWHERGADNPGWDGITRVGTKAKSGVYYYAIVAQGWDGRDFKVGGYVHIFY